MARATPTNKVPAGATDRFRFRRAWAYIVNEGGLKSIHFPNGEIRDCVGILPATPKPPKKKVKKDVTSNI